VNGPKVCAALFEPFATSSPRTLLLLDSQPGDTVGGGTQRVFSAGNSAWSVTSSSAGDRLSVSVSNDPDRWRLEFTGPRDVPLGVGTYDAARTTFSPFNGLSVTGESSCSRVTGRFVIRELVFGPGGSVLRFAADFEQHCNDLAPGLFGSVRFNSTIAEVDPFDGAYPVYELTVSPSANGRVTGGTIDCGGVAPACTQSLAAAGSITLTALPDAGYVFTGWTDDCRAGTSSVTVHVNGPKLCSAQFEPLVSASPRTMLFMDSQTGDYVGQGRQWFYIPANSAWRVSTSSNGNTAYFDLTDDTSYWTLRFSAPEGEPLAVGTYIDVRSWISSFSRLEVSGHGRSCSNPTGRFVIHEIAFGPGSALERFAADFELHCGDVVPGLFGAVRYNASTDTVLPFGGTYPQYQLTLQRPANGTITGTSLDCGTSGAACQVTLGAAAVLTLNAQPDTGYLFAGWTGDCHGATATTIHVNGPKLCGALFQPLVSSAPRTLLFLDSQPSEHIGQGAQMVYAAANSRWTLTSFSSSRNSVSVTVADSLEQWRLEFARPSGQPLTVGEYTAVRRSTPFNRMLVDRSSRSCSTLTGRFVILEIVFGTNNSVTRFAADFEQHCDDGVPALFGAIRYNSTISETRPFAGAYPIYRATIAPPSHGRVTGVDLNCGGGASACTRTLSAAAQLTLMAIPDPGYAFMGWTEDCIGAAMTTLHVNGPKRCAALFDTTVAAAPRTVYRWNAAPVGGFPASSGVLTPANSVWSVSGISDRSSVRFWIESLSPASTASSYIEFYAPSGESLQVGRRYTTTSSYGTAGTPGLWATRSGLSCSGGEFTIREMVLGTQGAVTRFAAEFIARCGFPATPSMTGTLQYNSLVDASAMTLSVEPSSLRFAALHNGGSVTTQPSPQTLRVTLGSTSVGWTAVASQPWLQLAPASGTGTGVMTVTADLLGRPAGTGSDTATITVTLTDGSATSRTINVNVTLHFNGTTSPPFGFVDTPVQNTTGVTGAIPMTGWALDDLEIASLTICRAAVGGETPIADANCGGAAQIFVGSGVFIEGARPDVQVAYPNHPRAERGGWGFMLLTNMLPNGGNGTFVFHVYARDREGNVALLGTRTMTCSNASATAPFGAIDTPGQGETISGSSYLNFGWVLTPQPKSIPIDGSTLMVYVDGAAVGRPNYNNFRSDIAALFPGYANTNGAVAHRLIDTTTLTNGLHTIVWTATDNAGVTSGIGSRYFRVANGVSSGISSAALDGSAAATTAADVDRIPLDSPPIAGRRGWNDDAAWTQYAVGRSGRAVVRGEEIDRFELDLGPHQGETYTGYLRVGDRLQPLPIGSRLDPRTGSFTWSPGVGFVGTYDLVFVRSRDGAAVARLEVRFVLQPKGGGHVGAQVVIDTPRSQQDLAQPFLLGGWAVDRDAPAGTGVDAVHVWAYPLAGGAPVFLGAAAMGGTRPDVAAVLGDEFRDAGFNLTVQGLTPGHYDLAVFAWSRVTNGFVPAQVVRVTAR
jgi:hypothetical protein